MLGWWPASAIDLHICPGVSASGRRTCVRSASVRGAGVRHRYSERSPERLPRTRADGRKIAAVLRARDLLESEQAFPSRALIERAPHRVAIHIVVGYGIEGAIALAERSKVGRVGPRSASASLVGRDERCPVPRSDNERTIRLPKKCGHSSRHIEHHPQRPASLHRVIIVDSEILPSRKTV